jgi:hypothetical protein
MDSSSYLDQCTQEQWDALNQSLANILGIDYTPSVVEPMDIQPLANSKPWNKGKTGLQPSTRKGTKQKPLTPEHREKIRQSMLATTNAMEDPANRAKISAKLKGRTFTPEWRAKLKAASAKRWGKGQ